LWSGRFVDELPKMFAMAKGPELRVRSLEGIMKESNALLAQIEDVATRDVALLASAQAIEITRLAAT
jgi:ferritin-like metal-binding protein YciE